MNAFLTFRNEIEGILMVNEMKKCRAMTTSYITHNKSL